MFYQRYFLFYFLELRYCAIFFFAELYFVSFFFFLGGWACVFFFLFICLHFPMHFIAVLCMYFPVRVQTVVFSLSPFSSKVTKHERIQKYNKKD